MQRVIIALLAIAALACGGFAYHFQSQLSALSDELAALTNERDAARAAEKLAQREAASAKENSARLTRERDVAKANAKKAADVAPLIARAEVAAAPEGEGKKDEKKDFMAGMAKMFEGEEGKKMLRAQSDMVVKMMYGDLAKELKLSPKDAETVMALLADRQGALTTAGMSVMSGGEDAAKKVGDLKKEQDANLKAALGEDGFKQLEGYERTLGDRMMLQQFDGQFNAAGSPLVGQQRQDLLAVMTAERAKTPASALSNGNSDPGAAMAAMQDESLMTEYMKNEAEYQQRVLQKSAGVLNPDQVNTLGKAFEQQKTMTEFGMKMSKGMFGKQGEVLQAPTPAGAKK